MTVIIIYNMIYILNRKLFIIIMWLKVIHIKKTKRITVEGKK